MKVSKARDEQLPREIIANKPQITPERVPKNPQSELVYGILMF
jgi:hypothetical protein